MEYWQLEGELKKKRKKTNLLSAFDQSVNRYFAFRCGGKYLCYFECKPVRFE